MIILCKISLTFMFKKKEWNVYTLNNAVAITAQLHNNFKTWVGASIPIDKCKMENGNFFWRKVFQF